mmetsp:Transcript_18772/g.44501  ORF Transcript_18772/g.44501 Transcript_18772/m.44501 type:complete len:209 (+) Transcript_18772:1093-1719(+)
MTSPFRTYISASHSNTLGLMIARRSSMVRSGARRKPHEAEEVSPPPGKCSRMTASISPEPRRRHCSRRTCCDTMKQQRLVRSSESAQLYRRILPCLRLSFRYGAAIGVGSPPGSQTAIVPSVKSDSVIIDWSLSHSPRTARGMPSSFRNRCQSKLHMLSSISIPRSSRSFFFPSLSAPWNTSERPVSPLSVSHRRRLTNTIGRPPYRS